MRSAQCSASEGGQCGRKASAVRGRDGFWEMSEEKRGTTTLMRTGMNLSSCECGTGANGTGFAGASLGAMPQSQAEPEQHPI